MTREEFRASLLRNRNNSADDMVNSVVDFMIEMKSVAYEEVLDMPSTVLDEFLEGLKRRADMEKQAYEEARRGNKTFG